MIQQFAEWLSQTSLSILIQTHNAWVIPTIQSIHTIAIGVVLTSVPDDRPAYSGMGRERSNTARDHRNRRTVKSLAILTPLIWVCIVVLGRLIGYDYVWGSWSLKPKA